jgi:hypothetical protein
LTKKELTILTMKENIHELYNALKNRPEQTQAIEDITDVLLQVYQTIDDSKNPEALVNRLVNYIYGVGHAGNLTLGKEAEANLIALGGFGQRAGWNGSFRADYSAKSQFFPLFPKKS